MSKLFYPPGLIFFLDKTTFFFLLPLMRVIIMFKQIFQLFKISSSSKNNLLWKMVFKNNANLLIAVQVQNVCKDTNI